ncbi:MULTISPECIES: PhzF family phenazine biosynthesis isomerase [unclassified Synechocystis]|uniref:PhzF family phenazine biosynthesis isomerase n=1 Tax=unclassified Synechocystis TaxID=2640012 RepID=UPI0003F837D5|nr:MULTISPECIES: PhzF family phenazine biosynthesis isomerase [unclassified Synechocystis]AIE74195.1 Phenazine biosynthesis protein PhzF [Synechocystis sp. PCC 6714]MCT0252827.1 PhzF family phenazine biosynthesis isomerase [Synechocystis sp. CS-94]
MRYGFFTLDVFTDRIFGGNPLAVFPDAQGLTPEQMQNIAAEINYSETVFVLPPVTDQGKFRLRIFTPKTELDFAGHPTIGAAYLLGLLHPPSPLLPRVSWQLEEPVGLVPVTLYYHQEKLGQTELTVAQLPHSQSSVPSCEALATLLGLSVDQLQKGDYGAQAYSCGLPFLFVPLINREALAAIKFNQLVWQDLLANHWAHCVYCLAPAEPPLALLDNRLIYGRMFAPGLGITEDPATGSAVAALGGYLGDRLRECGTFRWQIEQGVELGRPSQLQLTVIKENQSITTVRVAGRSVLVTEGWMNL